MSKENLDNQIWKNKFFPNPLTEKEDIIMVLREDLVILVFQALSFIFFFLVATLLRAILTRFFDQLGPGKYILDIVYNTFNIFLLVGFLMRFHDYYLSVQIITSQRIIDVSQKGLFGREVNELQYDKIEDVTHKQNGLIATMFNFGDIVVQTAASASLKTSGFVFKNIPNPSRAHKVIMDVTHNSANKSPQTSYVVVQNSPASGQQLRTFDPSQVNPGQYVPNPLSPNYRENVLNASDELNRKP